MRRIIQLAGYSLSAIGVLLLILWAMRGAQPAIDCGLINALTAADWSGAYICLDRSDYDPLIALFAMLGGALLTFAARLAPGATGVGVYNPTPEERKNNRAELIRRVRRIWITGYLDQSLYQEVLLYLGMQWNPADTLPNPFGMTALRLDEKAREFQPPDITLTVGAPLAAFYANVDHRLLILGAPGAGKTTVMLDLARTFLDKAEQDLSIPAPVIFMLSSWPGPATPFEEWLVSEIRTRYGGDIHEDVARYWLAHNEIALFLDGLDELPAERRAAAVAAIEAQQTLGSWFVVCSRAAEYANLDARKVAFTNLDAVNIQPLKLYQIQGYLGELRSEQAVRLSAAIAADKMLQEVADTPLMLNVMLLASEVINWTQIAGADKDTPRSRIYDAYVQATLLRKRDGVQYAPKKTLHWLQWLAQKMAAHGQTVFLLESLRRSWFNQSWQRYIWIPTLGLLVGSCLGLVFGLYGKAIPGLIGGFINGLIFGLIGGLFFGYRDVNLQGQTFFQWNLGALRSALLAGVQVGLLFGGNVFLLFALYGVFNGWLINGLIAALTLGLIVGLIVALFAGVVLAVLSQLSELSSMRNQSEDYTTRKNGVQQVVRNLLNVSARVGLLVGLVLGLMLGLFSMVGLTLTEGAISGLTWGLIGWLILGPLLGLAGGLTLGSAFAFETVIKHYTLRLVVALDGSMPFRYVRFLDACTDRILLRRVGGGYMFIHTTFRDHIAALTPERIDELARRVEAQRSSQ